VTAALPSGVVTFLFTDIEGSTRRWEAEPEAMKAALAAHDEVLRSAIEEHGGWLFKHTGDGMCAVFTSPRAAVDAAIEAQRALELPVRMGISTGEAELRGSDYFGAVLNRAARAMAAGHGGQVLLDGVTAGLLRGLNLLDLGSRRLRDISQPVQVFQVCADGLPTEFPPLRTLDSNPGNLRPASTSFIGRETEIGELQEILKAHRLVTLTGAGGVGKTRLAVEVAARLADQFPDGVWFFDLAAVTDLEAVPDAVAGVLGLVQQPGKTVTESVAAALEGRARLLVMDNCEHVVDAAADVAEAILAASATVTILATSREGLGVADEQQWRVPSLDVRSGPESPAVTLFLERAHRVVSDVELDQPGQAEAVVEICRRLDGIPLAIELAASRMASMTASEVRDRLDDRFRLLVGSRRSLSRHQTLRHAVAWSYDLLSDDEKLLLDRCSVFAGGFDLQSACAVADSDDEYAVLDHLDALVRKSLLTADRSSGHTRYSMLETIRQFAEDQLATSGEIIEVRNRHARYFADKEIEVTALWDSPRQRQAYDWFNTELPNLRTAFRWAAENGDLDTATAITTYAMLFGALLENYEPLAWGEELIEPARAVDHPRLANLYLNVSQCYWTGRFEEAVTYADAAWGLFRSGRYEVAIIEGTLGSTYLSVGQPERAVEWCRAQTERGPDTHTLVRSMLVIALMMAGKSEEAKAAATGIIEAAEATHNPWALANALYTFGYVFAESDPPAALDALRRGLVIAHDSGSRLTESLIATMLARLETEHGDPLAALDYITSAVANFYDSGNIAYIQFALAILAVFFDRLGHLQPAATIAGYALNVFTTTASFQLSTVIDHLRNVLGDETYESLAHKGRTMTASDIVAYAYDQIEQARAALTAVAE